MLKNQQITSSGEYSAAAKIAVDSAESHKSQRLAKRRQQQQYQQQQLNNVGINQQSQLVSSSTSSSQQDSAKNSDSENQFDGDSLKLTQVNNITDSDLESEKRPFKLSKNKKSSKKSKDDSSFVIIKTTTTTTTTSTNAAMDDEAEIRRRYLHLDSTGGINDLEKKSLNLGDQEDTRGQLKGFELSEDGEQDLVPTEGTIEATLRSSKDQNEFKAQLVWTNIILFVILHSCLPIGIYMIYTQWPWRTLLFSLFGIYASGLGVTGGSHRLWSHRSYKAKWPVQVLLVILQTMAGQNSIYTWSRDHRVHHKFSETNADPHNIKRGFFFAHMGWLCCKKHPDVKEKGKLIDMSDLEANPYVMFQHRNFWWMSALFTVLVPTMIPVLLWGERFWTAFVFSFMVRYLITLHGTWLVNSAAHYYGDRPYDKRIEARESPYVIYNGLGEGFHNYHHTFPYDYATSEFGKYWNITTTFIDLCASIGLVKDRRKVDSESIMKRRLRTGILADIDEIEESSEDKKNKKPTEKSSGREDNSKASGQSLVSCGRLLMDNWRLSSASVVKDSAQQSSLISMIHA